MSPTPVIEEIPDSSLPEQEDSDETGYGIQNYFLDPETGGYHPNSDGMPLVDETGGCDLI